ncbi:MAG: hypothetical protein NVS3B10_20740 [Polyangiales bacterium]
MRILRALPLALPLAVAASTLLVATLAAAEPIAFTSGFPRRTGTMHAATGAGSGVSRIDCVDPLEAWTVSFALPAAVSFDTLQVWARRDPGSCADDASRSGGAKKCARVASFTQAQVQGGAFVEFPSAAILEAAALGTDVAPTTKLDRGAICYPPSAEEPQPFTLDFLLFQGAAVVGGGAPNAYEASISSVYDRSGPPGPQDLTSTVSPSSKGSIDARWTPDPKLGAVAVNAYCFDLDSAGVTGCALPDGVLVAGGYLAPEVDRSPCVTATNAGVLRVDGLRRNHPFAIAIAYVDALGNTGTLSNFACATPTGDLVPAGSSDPGPPPPVGCSCTLPTRGAPGGAALAAVVALLLGGLRRRGQRD